MIMMKKGENNGIYGNVQSIRNAAQSILLRYGQESDIICQFQLVKGKKNAFTKLFSFLIFGINVKVTYGRQNNCFGINKSYIYLKSLNQS